VGGAFLALGKVGDPSPSAEDIEVIVRLAEACEVVGIALFDGMEQGSLTK